MINPFLADSKTRLAAWKTCRSEIGQLTDITEQFDCCLNFWRNAPIQNHVLNWDDCNTWPTAWEQMEENNFCSSGLSLAVANTLILAKPHCNNYPTLGLITDQQVSIQKIVVYADNWVLNHDYLDRTPKNHLQHVYKHVIWKWTGKQWQIV